MGKRRKSSGRRQEGPAGPNLDVGSSRKRIRDFEDVADSDDEFHLNRDRVLLDEEPEAKRRRKWQEQEEFLEPSDEEVLEYSDEDGSVDGNPDPHEDGSDSEESDHSEAEAGEDDEAGWGMVRGEVYGADEIETEEQALEEEKEALRLQKKQLQAMTAADYGFDEAEWQDGGVEEIPSTTNVVTEILPQLEIRTDMSDAEKFKLLKSRYPEFEPLRVELLALHEVHKTLTKYSDKKQAHARQEQYPNLLTKLRACAAYLGALTMYFALLTSPVSLGQDNATALPPGQLREHSVMDTLVQCKELWQRTKDLPPDATPASNGITTIPQPTENVSLEELRKSRKPKAERAPQKSRAQRHAEAMQAETEKRKAERLQRTEADLADLDTLMLPLKARKSKMSSSRNRDQPTGSDFEEEAALTAHEAAEKAKRKKSLRFYTSQIAQKANKRGAAGRNAGGDDDIPYRERLKDRQARLNAEAERRGQRKGTTDAGADLGGQSDEEDARQAREVKDGADLDYYDLIAARTAKKKADKAARAAAHNEAEKWGGRVREEETVGSDGKFHCLPHQILAFEIKLVIVVAAARSMARRFCFSDRSIVC